MVRRLIPCLAILALTTPALAQDGWNLKGNRVKYELDLQKPPVRIGDAVKIPDSFVVGEGSFENGRTPTWSVAEPGDLAWYYVLRLPEGPLDKKREIPVQERFKVRGGELIATGTQKLKPRSKRLSLVTTLEISSTVQNHPMSGQTAMLEMRANFDKKKGMMRDASFELSAAVAIPGAPGGPGKLVWRGKVKPGEAFDVGKAGFHVQVERAIEKGKNWLLRQTRSRLGSYKGAGYGGQKLGRMALPCFALLRSGVTPRELQNEFAWMSTCPHEETYSVSLWIMALEALSIQRQKVRARDGTRSVARYERGEVADKHKQLMKLAVDWLVENRKDGWWNYKGIKATPDRRGDRSNSQFAILALHSAMACEVEVPRKVWEEILAEVLKGQERGGPNSRSLDGSVFTASSPLFSGYGGDVDEAAVEEDGTRVRPKDGDGTESRSDRDRGWAYGSGNRAANGSAYGSMTAAGVSSLAVAREALGAGGGATSAGARGSMQALRDGLAWLGTNLDPGANPGRGDKHYYYWLYSLEKAMDTSGVDRLGKREWWREVASELLGRQQASGAWGNVEDTSLALLVLNRATLPAKLEIEALGPSATGQDDASTWDKVALEGVGKLGVRQLLATMASSPEMAAKQLKLARQALAALDEERRGRVVPGLARLLDCEHKGTRKWAEAACKDLAGTTNEDELREFSKDYAFLLRAGEARDAAAIPQVRKAFKRSADAPALRRQALLVLTRLRAVEAIPDAIDALEVRDTDQRGFAWSCLASLAGGEQRPFDPSGSARSRAEQVSAWREWYREEGSALASREALRRALADLGRPKRADAAAAVFEEHGKASLPFLIDALQGSGAEERAHALLKKISGVEIPADPDAWRTWMRTGQVPEVVASREPAAAPPKEEDPEVDFGFDDDEAPEEDDEEEPAEDEGEPAVADAQPAAPPKAEGGARDSAVWGLVPRPSQKKD